MAVCKCGNIFSDQEVIAGYRNCEHCEMKAKAKKGNKKVNRTIVGLIDLIITMYVSEKVRKVYEKNKGVGLNE